MTLTFLFVSVVLLADANGSTQPQQTTLLLEHFLQSAGVTKEEAASLSWVTRFDLDVDGDRIKELFLALPGTNTGQDWVVYSCARDATCRSLGAVRFHASLFFYSLPNRRLWAYRQLTAEEGGWAQYFLGPNGFEKDVSSRPRGSWDDQRDLSRAKEWVRHSKPPQGWAKMADLLGGKEAWEGLETHKEVLAPLHLSRLRVKQ